MSASLSTYLEAATNPLDVLEQIVAANDLSFYKRNDSEMAEAPGRWCDYGLYFNWSRRSAPCTSPAPST